MEFLAAYGSVSGQMISKDKSKFDLGKASVHRVDQVRTILGFQEGCLPFTYLGVPIFRGKPRQIHLQLIADKVKSKLAGSQGL